MDDVAGWLDGLPEELSAQRRLLQRLLDWCQREDDVRWLTVGCSLERGNADWMSDVDVAIGVSEDHFESWRVGVTAAGPTTNGVLGGLDVMRRASPMGCRTHSRPSGRLRKGGSSEECRPRTDNQRRAPRCQLSRRH
jgi:hypothetical protein